jgi:hypothetical protein
MAPVYRYKNIRWNAPESTAPSGDFNYNTSDSKPQEVVPTLIEAKNRDFVIELSFERIEKNH